MAKRKYRVISRANTMSHPKGTVFEHDFDKDLHYNEADLISRGALEKVGKNEKSDSEPEPLKRPPIAGVKGEVKEG